MPTCPVCGLWQVKPTQGLPRHMFCIAVRKAARGLKDAIAFLERCKPSLPESSPTSLRLSLSLGGTDAGPNQHREGGGCADNYCLGSPVPLGARFGGVAISLARKLTARHLSLGASACEEAAGFGLTAS